MRKKNNKVGAILKKAREGAKMSLPTAAMLFGLHDMQRLWRCENGIDTFPVHLLKRASEIYGIPLEELTKADIADYSESLKEEVGSK